MWCLLWPVKKPTDSESAQTFYPFKTTALIVLIKFVYSCFFKPCIRPCHMLTKSRSRSVFSSQSQIAPWQNSKETNITRENMLMESNSRHLLLLLFLFYKTYRQLHLCKLRCSWNIVRPFTRITTQKEVWKISTRPGN